ncbi:hypothetical protein JG688_00018527 [Phytophthora aleatoria]|uniref:Uncharacterized protein n=1 Tax=Phytophthora aleatoria TaxID=2496075 RepID=A0A8J5HZF9_9STRA|nr:hypothetical protein JG688_00018527 [Phytophthora aleatoria]
MSTDIVLDAWTRDSIAVSSSVMASPSSAFAYAYVYYNNLEAQFFPAVSDSSR